MLNERSKQIRRDTIALSKANGGYHYGGCFSYVEILIALFDHVMGPDDRFILSKGHACWPLYVILRERGLNPKLGGHPERDPANGIWATTGSLGHGLSMASGMALAGKRDDKKHRVFVIMSDGECDEGSVWEAALFSSHHKLDNLTLIIDYNKLQAFGRTNDVLKLEPLKEKWQAFGWAAREINGHNFSEIEKTLLTVPFVEGKPSVIIAHTIKGKGVSFMEDKLEWHYNNLSKEDYQRALKELV